MKRVKIARIITRLNIGGPATHTILLNEGLNKDEFETLLITGMPAKDEGDMSYVAREKGLEVRVIPEFGRKIKFLSDLRTLWKLYKIIRKERPEIVHTHTAKAGALGRLAALTTGVPILVHTFHGHVFHDYFNPFATRVFILIERLFARFTDRLLVVSQAIQDDVCLRFRIADRSRVSIVRLGLNLENFKNIDSRKGIFRKELGIEEDILLVGIVGRLTPIKNHSLFLKAATLAAEGLKPIKVKFLIIGDGELRDELKGYSAKLGIEDLVYFIGWRERMPEVYADLDIVVLTSLNEGTPLSLIEAMAAKRAVVSTAVGGVPNLIQDGKTGLLVRSDDAMGLKETLLKLAKDSALRKRLGEAASDYVYERHSKEQLVSDMAKLYRELIEKAK